MFRNILRISILLLFFIGFGYLFSRLVSYVESNIRLWERIEAYVNSREGVIEEELILVSVEEKVEIAEDNVNLGVPVSIRIESVGIDLEVKEGIYDYEERVWTITNGYAYWANLSDSIFQKNSNTVIYAHNQKNEFGKLKNINIGDKIVVTTDSGNTLVFEYFSDNIVDPNNSSVIFEEVDVSRLVLITCNGVFSEDRRILYARLVD